MINDPLEVENRKLEALQELTREIRNLLAYYARPWWKRLFGRN